MSALRRSRSRVAVAGAALAAVLAVQGCTTTQDPATDRPGGLGPRLARLLDDLVQQHGFPAAQVTIDGPGGHRVLTAGAGDTVTGAPIGDGARVRIGSNTKTFVATVVLQLVAEGKVDLDAPIERYLPGVVRGNGNDGDRVTVRQLLQHTSGLPDYLASGDPAVPPDPGSPQLRPDAEKIRWAHYESADLVRIAMSMPPRFEPGARSVYTNTNYILLGMLIEAVTGRPAAAEITARILEPLGLRDTYFPDPGETTMRGPHPRGYQDIDGARADFTDLDPSWAGTAGAMVATPADLNRFFAAVLTGKLLPAAQVDQMRRTVPFDRGEPGAGYGLGLIRQPVSCGKEVWGHGGSIPGFETRNGVAVDGTVVVVVVNQLPADHAAADAVAQVFNAAICS
ncbi:serine hydrolase domain-containing protein [Nocardia sp. NPDC059764]|uniref:serine hydrolase domain-containing protein n=1 Tax=Nocardia sp. NPDC059764 TaxID=3346939 RepID=UPI003664E8B6